MEDTAKVTENQGLTWDSPMNLTEFYTAVLNELEHYPEAKLHHPLMIMESITPGFSFDDTIEVYTDEREIGIAVEAFYKNLES